MVGPFARMDEKSHRFLIFKTRRGYSPKGTEPRRFLLQLGAQLAPGQRGGALQGREDRALLSAFSTRSSCARLVCVRAASFVLLVPCRAISWASRPTTRKSAVVLAATAHAANVRDGRGARPLFERLFETVPIVKGIWADQAHEGDLVKRVKTAFSCTLDIGGRSTRAPVAPECPAARRPPRSRF